MIIHLYCSKKKAKNLNCSKRKAKKEQGLLLKSSHCILLYICGFSWFVFFYFFVVVGYKAEKVADQRKKGEGMTLSVTQINSRLDY